MANVYSTQLIASHAGAFVEFSCPGGMRAVVKAFTLFNAFPDNQTAHLIHRQSGCTILQWRVAATAIVTTDNQSVQNLLWFVFNEYESIYTANDSGIDMTVSGFLLDLP